MKLSPNAPCPCGSETKLKKCCGRFHAGRPAPPQLLMRARYTAYATGNVAFVMDTTHPDGPQANPDRAAWKRELTDYCRATVFDALVVHDDQVDDEAGRATVTFTATLIQGGRNVGFTERSLFVRDGARWKYHSGEMLPEVT